KPDISTLQRIGHFYFALTRPRGEIFTKGDHTATPVGVRQGTALVLSRKSFSQWGTWEACGLQHAISAGYCAGAPMDHSSVSGQHSLRATNRA
ncbi:MAG: hypothetical protein ABI759_30495, partial [Candidatus Solibacter sp.]